MRKGRGKTTYRHARLAAASRRAPFTRSALEVIMRLGRSPAAGGNIACFNKVVS